MNVVLPEHLAELVRKRVAERGFTCPEEYIHKLILDDDTDQWWASLTDEEKRERQEFSRLIREADASGPTLSSEEAWAEVLRHREERSATRAARPRNS
jgi:hypothetical protein